MLPRLRTGTLLVVLCLGHVLLISAQVPASTGSSRSSVVRRCCARRSHERTNKQVTELILKYTGKGPELIKHVADRPGHDRRYAMNIEGIATELDWHPRQSLDSGLFETVRWYLEHPQWVQAVRQQRDYQFVLDHCEAIDLVLHNGKLGEVYNVGTEREIYNIDMAHMILDLLGKPRSLLQHVEDRPGHDRRYSLNVTKLRGLGWEPAHTFEEALEKTVRWYVANEWWWRKLKSGEYRDYYSKQYATRAALRG